MLFTLVIGIATTLVFGFRALIVKLRFILSGGKTEKTNSSKLPYVIFCDHKRYWNIFKPICDEFEKRQIPLHYFTQSEDDPVFNAGYKFITPQFIGEGNKGFLKMNMLNAGVVMSTTPGLDVLQWKRSKNVNKYVHIPHTVDDLSGYRMFALDHYDSVLCTGQNQVDFIKKIEDLRPKFPKKDLVIVGSPNMDEAFNRVKTFEKTTQDNKLTVLLAPSWGPSSILNRFGEKLISELIKSGYKIIIRPHPQSYTAEKELLENLKNTFNGQDLEWNKDNDNLSVMNRSNILITDFSGIMFDYSLLFNKPFLYADTNFDTSVYDADWIDDKMWVFKAAERIGIELQEEQFPNLKTIIENAINNSKSSTNLEEVRNECWQNIGNSAKAIVEYITKEE